MLQKQFFPQQGKRGIWGQFHAVTEELLHLTLFCFGWGESFIKSKAITKEMEVESAGLCSPHTTAKALRDPLGWRPAGALYNPNEKSS